MAHQILLCSNKIGNASILKIITNYLASLHLIGIGESLVVAKKHNIDPSNIETHFALLKRTAKSNNVEIFNVSSGAKKTENAFKLLDKAIYNIKKSRFIKNKLSCTSGYGCEFYKTEYCT